MLDGDYQRLLGQLMSSLPERIQLPETHEHFFSESGPTPPFPDDRRSSPRTRARTHGVLIPETDLPAFPRASDPLAIYTSDFSKTGFGFVAPEQFYPGEDVRIVLATFWMRVTVRRCRRLGAECYEVGAVLVSRSDPSAEAFAGVSLEQEPVL